MALFGFGKRNKPAPAVMDAPAEAREAPVQSVMSSDPGLATFLGLSMASAVDEIVTVETALGVPAVLSAVTFLSRSLASLPLKVFEESDGVPKVAQNDPVGHLLNGVANDETTAFELRRGFWQDVFTEGRGLAFIERNGRNEPINLWPLIVAKTEVRRVGRKTFYIYRDGTGSKTYEAAEVLDLAFMQGADRLSARSPIRHNADTIGLAQAVTKYGARFFNNGGIPPFVVQGPIKSAVGMQNAAADLTQAVKDMTENRRNGIAIPDGHELKPVGVDPDKMQMVDTKRFLIEEIARIYNMPPAFLGDLTNGTFSNVEQQDLALVKHLLAPWCKAFEREVQLKLYGRKPGAYKVRHVLDGILRGDFKTRAEALAAQINTGQITPDEAREIEKRPPLPGGDQLVIQGAMVPLDSLGSNNEGDGNV
jgi:HK97 family phage portal protein